MTTGVAMAFLWLALGTCLIGLKWFFCELRCRDRAAMNMALTCDYVETLIKLQEIGESLRLDEMTAATVRERIKYLIDKGAVHRKGYRIVEVPTDQILVRAGEELQELKDEPDDIEELADTMLCLMHYQIRKGWSQRELVAAMLHKLSIRFTIPEEHDGRGSTGSHDDGLAQQAEHHRGVADEAGSDQRSDPSAG